MLIEYDPEADAIFVRLRQHEGELHARRIDESRLVHDDADGNPVAVELLWVSRGISLEGLPEAKRIEAALDSLRELRSG